MKYRIIDAYAQGRLPLSGIRPPADPKGSPFGTFEVNLFWPTDLKTSLKAPLAPIYTNFEGGARAEKTQFFGQNFPKCLKTPFLDCFCKIENLVETGTKLCLGRAGKFNSVDLKKRSTKFFRKFFESPPPPLEKIPDPPLPMLITLAFIDSAMII